MLNQVSELLLQKTNSHFFSSPAPMVPSLLTTAPHATHSQQFLPLHTAHFASPYLSVPWHLPFMLSSAFLPWDFSTVPHKPAPKNISSKYSVRKENCPVQVRPVQIRHSSLFVES